jgi:hypothetical protein
MGMTKKGQVLGAGNTAAGAGEVYRISVRGGELDTNSKAALLEI